MLPLNLNCTWNTGIEVCGFLNSCGTSSMLNCLNLSLSVVMTVRGLCLQTSSGLSYKFWSSSSQSPGSSSARSFSYSSSRSSSGVSIFEPESELFFPEPTSGDFCPESSEFGSGEAGLIFPPLKNYSQIWGARCFSAETAALYLAFLIEVSAPFPTTFPFTWYSTANMAMKREESVGISS